jgi:hypothetical protein
MLEEELAVFLKEDLWLQTINVRPQGYKRQQNNKINNRELCTSQKITSISNFL